MYYKKENILFDIILHHYTIILYSEYIYNIYIVYIIVTLPTKPCL